MGFLLNVIIAFLLFYFVVVIVMGNRMTTNMTFLSSTFRISKRKCFNQFSYFPKKKI